MPSSQSRLRFYFTELCQFSKHNEDRDLSTLCCGNLKENRNDDSKSKGRLHCLFLHLEAEMKKQLKPRDSKLMKMTYFMIKTSIPIALFFLKVLFFQNLEI